MAWTRPAAIPSVLGPEGAPGMPSCVHPYHGTIRHVGLETATNSPPAPPAHREAPAAWVTQRRARIVF